MEALPLIGNTYDCYDDGKITPSRRYDVIIRDIVSFEKAKEEIILEWNYNLTNYHWLFSESTDYFLIADSYEQDDVVTKSIFVRTKDGGWFSFGLERNNLWNSGRLIIE